MNYWILTDTHFGHQKMREYCQRPEGFEELILKRIHQCVRLDDVIIHLGDFCFNEDKEWHQKFRNVCDCKRWLVRGNHDKNSISWYLHYGWDCVVDELMFEMFGKRIVFSHKPISIREDLDLNIHGHHHNNEHHPEDITTKKHILVYIEHNYSPINLKNIIERNVK